MQVENGVAVPSYLGGVRLAVEHTEGTAGAFGRVHLELARGESEQVSRQRLRFGEPHNHAAICRFAPDLRAVGSGLPRSWNIQRERIAGLETGLIEARKRVMRARRNEQCV